jgi:LPS-assembly protein
MTGSYDFESDRGTLAGLGVEFRNECVSVDLSLSRRFTSSTSVSPTTELSVAVRLSGFGTGSDGRMYRKSCGG